MSQIEQGSLVAGDLFSPQVIRDPFELYRRLRSETPMATEDGVWVVMRHRDVFAVLSDHRTYSSDLRHLDNPVLRETPIIFEDPPGHTRHRRLVQPAFTSSRMAAIEPFVSEVVDDLLDTLGSGELDAVTALCDPLPVKVIAYVMGVPVEEHRRFKRWADERTRLVTGRGRPGSGDDPGRWADAEEANRQLLAYFLAQSADRRVHPMADLISEVVRGNGVDPPVDDATVASMCALLLTAGNVTTTHLLANMLALLAEHPDVLAALRSDPEMAVPVVEEVLRLESPVQWLYRRTTRPAELNGQTIPQGASVIVYFGAANRDPDAYPAPDTFDVIGRRDRHAAFGHGIHFCLGAPLARLEAAVAVRAVAARFSRLVVDVAQARRASASATQFGYEYLPVRFER